MVLRSQLPIIPIQIMVSPDQKSYTKRRSKEVPNRTQRRKHTVRFRHDDLLTFRVLERLDRMMRAVNTIHSIISTKSLSRRSLSSIDQMVRDQDKFCQTMCQPLMNNHRGIKTTHGHSSNTRTFAGARRDSHIRARERFTRACSRSQNGGS